MAWDADEERWQRGLLSARNYVKQYGNLDVRGDYTDKDGFALSAWIRLKRRQKKAGTLKEDQARALEALGIHWNVFSDMWDEMYIEAQSYYQKYSDLNVPRGYIGSNGKRLDMWIQKQRREYDKLSAEQRKKLEKITQEMIRT